MSVQTGPSPLSMANGTVGWYSASLLASAVVALSVVHLEVRDMYLLWVALGHGHTTSQYLYKVRRRQVTRRGLALFIALGVALFLIFWWIPDNSWCGLIVVGSAYNLIHIIIDEKTFFGQSPCLASALEALPIVLMLTAFALREANGTDLTWLAAVLSALCVVLYVVLVVVKGYRPRAASYAFWALSAVPVACWMAGRHVPMIVWMAPPLIYHYARWYIHGAFRSQGSPAQLRDYLYTIGIVNLLVLGLFGLYLRSPGVGGTGGLAALFGFHNFNVWAQQHFIISSRRRDLAYLTRLV